MTAKKAAPAKKAPAPEVAKADPDNTLAPKRGEKPDEAGSADPASDSIARHSRPE